jgi:plasmid stabilization system protein ParE
MQIFRTRLYKTQLLRILKHIAKDKISASEKFHTDLEQQINNLIHSPYSNKFYSLRKRHNGQ